MIKFIVLVLLLKMTLGTSDIINLIQDYYHMKNVKNIVIIDCKSIYDNRNMLRKLSTHGYRTNIYNPKLIHDVPNILRRDDYKLGIVLNLNCSDSIKFLHKTSLISINQSLFSSNYNWMLHGKDNIGDSSVILSNLNVNIDAEIVFALSDSRSSYKLYDVYNSGRYHSGSFAMQEYGYYDGSLNVSNTYKYVRRHDMTGVVLKCMIVITKKLKGNFMEYVKTPYDTYIDSMNRFNFALLLHLREMFNFTYYMMRTNSWGYSHNGTFDGMVGYLDKKLVDIGGSPIFFRLERAKVIDYTIQTWISRPCFIFRHPKRTTSIFKVYLRPFDAIVWYCAIGIILSAIIVFYILYHFQNNIKTNDDERPDFALYVVGTIFQQGTANDLYFASGKIVIMTICIFSILFYQFYSASIVSSLLMQSPKTIKSLTDLLNSNLKAGIEDILYNIDYFAKTNDPVALALYQKKISYSNNRNIFNPSDGLAMVKKGGFAFHVDIATAYKIITDTFSEDEICELSEIQLFPPQRMMAIVQKGSPFRKLVIYGLRKISEVGLMTKQKLIWHEKKPECVQTANPSQFNVSLVNFSSALIFLLCGMLVSLFFLIMEIKLHKQI